MRQMLPRVLIFSFVLALANLYVAVSFYLATGASVVYLIFGTIFILELLMPILQRKGEDWARALPWAKPLLLVARIISYFALGGFSMVFFFTVIRDVTIFVLGFFMSSPNMELASQISLRFEIGFVLFLLVVGVIQALKGPGIKRVEVPMSGLPKAFEGFKIVQVSDLHIGPTIRTSYVGNVVRAVNKLQPDMIALTGDITDGAPADLAPIAKMLGEMKSTYGRFFVTGNHEYYWDAPAWIEVHRAAGTHVLINENHMIEKDGQSIAVLGVPDVSAHHFVAAHASDPALAAKGVPQATIKILLAHQPVSYKAGYLAGVNLQLSGHTHSGQFFPWSLVIGFFHDYYRGLNRFKNMWIYVNPGTGYWGPPLRAAVSSEITLLTLTCA